MDFFFKFSSWLVICVELKSNIQNLLIFPINILIKTQKLHEIKITIKNQPKVLLNIQPSKATIPSSIPSTISHYFDRFIEVLSKLLNNLRLALSSSSPFSIYKLLLIISDDRWE